MTPTDARVALLCAEIERDWREVIRQLERARGADPAESGPHAAWVALALSHAYEAFGALLARVERALDLSPRAGDRGHLDLLEEAALDVPRLRPAVVPSGALPAWTELLKFRHFLRHAYGADLDPAALRRNTERLASAVDETGPGLERLVAGLRAA